MIIGIIPSRYGSTRFPGKPLLDILGKTMLEWVIEHSLKATSLDKLVVATDDERIAEVARRTGTEAVMTRTDHTSGTDRCWEAYSRLIENGSVPDDSTNYIINIQGDEPFLDFNQIEELTTILDGTIEIATQMTTAETAESLHDPKEAKIIINANNEALYFSRLAVPYLAGIDPSEWHKHYHYHRQVGMYVYRADVLDKITQLPPSGLEMAESLEQLRWLEAGYTIKLVETNYHSYCVDEPGDVEKILQISSVASRFNAKDEHAITQSVKH
ncbi:3-deoxy-manno-octulosonate cytidylyltransferase [Spirosoma sp.]|uniref:3-deoxy-manno-octulosonate cytidylyltransferase n=1 Tax=Spirosoma sp. TaxID=1899569 RepID=UPI002621BA7B|nr:3-deoxy-manno-octulosonate cytidylyltransferase [Spirosoma sp.]MCX6215601.1 3-deoxy-manno-octulosonate cytidylyltransferase [Spirosoma sp.]